MTSKEALEILEELVERDTPKKIEYNDYEYPCCPDCGEVQCPNVYAMNNDFCPYCGQRLDWSEIEK
jgi:membrane protease subunit (stomatin/prohibitin family)